MRTIWVPPRHSRTSRVPGLKEIGGAGVTEPRILAPSDWLSRVSTRSCLVTRSTFGWSIFTRVLAAATRSVFDSTDRVGLLALAAGDVTLRRDAVFDWPLPFLGAALFVFRDFMERVDIIWA